MHLKVRETSVERIYEEWVKMLNNIHALNQLSPESQLSILNFIMSFITLYESHGLKQLTCLTGDKLL